MTDLLSRSPLTSQGDGVPRSPGRPGAWTSLVTVYRQQLARGRVARVPLLFVASFQSIGLLLLLRGRT